MLPQSWLVVLPASPPRPRNLILFQLPAGDRPTSRSAESDLSFALHSGWPLGPLACCGASAHPAGAWVGCGHLAVPGGEERLQARPAGLQRSPRPSMTPACQLAVSLTHAHQPCSSAPGKPVSWPHAPHLWAGRPQSRAGGLRPLSSAQSSHTAGSDPPTQGDPPSAQGWTSRLATTLGHAHRLCSQT